ncbi:MAG: SUMF1/EgtB/PvdO family nonheme iron enzyme [Chloroflexota bacterium]
MTNVFISYSRDDSDFVRVFNNALKQRGYDTWVDWQNIPRGETWLNEIYDGIDNANALVSVVSRHSLMSRACNDEISYARAHSKRILPLILERIEGEPFNEVAGHWITVPWEAQARANWQTLSEINWLFFTDTTKFEQEIDALIGALELDYAYLQAHTRYLIRALEWDRAGRKTSFLLFGDEIARAEEWLRLARAENKSPAVNPLHEAYISESRAAENQRTALAEAQQRRTRSLRRAALILGVMVALALVATTLMGISASAAAHESQLAGTNVAIASTDRARADAFRQQVEYNATIFALDQGHAQIMLSRFGIVPTEAETLAPEAIIARATAAADPTVYPTQTQRLAGTDMVEVPAGCFLMGSVIDSAAPVNKICFEASYWIDRTEVSRAQYNICVAAGTCSEAAANVYSADADQPINNVSWTQALTYCQWRGARLPTEPEWEYAARGPDSLIFPWGDQFMPDNLLYIGNSRFRTAPVGSRPPESASWVGALDMSGNVLEWVSTAFSSADFTKPYAYPYNPDDGREDLTRIDVPHIARGGSFNDNENNARGAHRAWGIAGETGDSNQLIGIRCATSQIEQPEAVG